MINNLDGIVELLTMLQTGETVVEATRKLQMLSHEPFFLKNLATILQNPLQNGQVKSLAAAFMNKVITQTLPELQQNYVIDVLTSVFYSNNIANTHKNFLQRAFIQLLQWSSTDNTQQIYHSIVAYFNTLQTILQNPTNSNLSSTQWNNNRQPHDGNHYCSISFVIHVENILELDILFETLLIVSRIFVIADVDLELVLGFIRRVLQPLLTLSVGELRMDIVFRKLVFKLWQTAIQKMFDSNQHDSKTILQQLSSSQKLLTAILDAYHYDCKTPNSSYLEIIHLQKLNQIIQCKTAAAQVHHTILNTTLKHQQFRSSNTPYFHSSISIQFPPLLDTLILYTRHREYFSPSSTIFLTQLLKIFNIYFSQYHELFKKQHHSIMHFILFPLLQADQQQMGLFEEDSHQFYQFASDCCDTQQSGTLKTTAAQLLENLVAMSNQSGQYAIRHCIISLQVKLSIRNDILCDDSMTILPLQTAFLILSLLSFRIEKDSNQMDHLCTIMRHQGLQRVSAFELTRVFLFLAFSYDLRMGETWILLAMRYDFHPTAQIAALDFLANIAKEYFSQDFFIALCDKIIIHPQKDTLLNTVACVIGDNMEKITEESMCHCVVQLLQFIDMQLTDYNQGLRKNTIPIANCLQIISKILKKSTYCQQKTQLLRILWTIVNKYKLLISIHLDDQLVRIISYFMDLSNTLAQQYFDILPNLILQFEDDGCLQLAYLTVFNQFIMKGTLQQITYLIDRIIEGLTQLTRTYHCSTNKVTRPKRAICNILILLQNFVAVHGPLLCEDILKQLVIASKRLIPEQQTPQAVPDRAMIARSIVLLYLCHMHRPNNVLTDLLNYQNTRLFIGYDLKVLSVCICRQLFRETQIIGVTQLINTLIRALSSDDTQHTKTNIKPKLRHNTTKIRISKVQDQQQILRMIRTPFDRQQIDPYQQLKTAIYQMRNNNPLLYQAIITSLPSTLHHNLSDILSRQVINNQQRHIVKINGIKYGPIVIQNESATRRTIEEDQDDDMPEQEGREEMIDRKKKKKKNSG